MTTLDPTLAHLIEERIPGQRYGVFFSTGEGTHFPNGDEESSGFVIAEGGRHYFYWTGWDAARQTIRFEEWQEESIGDESWADSAEYRAACAEAGWEPTP